jgi:hypothetical protein
MENRKIRREYAAATAVYSSAGTTEQPLGITHMSRSIWKNIVVLTAVAALSAPAFAGPLRPGGDSGSRGKAGSSVGRSVRGGGDTSFTRGSSGRVRSQDFRGGSTRGSGYRGASSRGSSTPILDALRDSGGRGGNRDSLRELGRWMDDYRDREYYRDREKEYRDANRDAMIANAVVNVVGIIAATQAQKYAQPAPVYAPAPVASAPAGHYETRRTVVQDGYYATERVWVPEYRDGSGAIVEGHYENHRRWVPPVYQETEVWVTP